MAKKQKDKCRGKLDKKPDQEPSFLEGVCEWPIAEITERIYGPGSGRPGSDLNDFSIDMVIRTSYLARVIATPLKDHEIEEYQRVGFNIVQGHFPNTRLEAYYPYYFYQNDNKEETITTALLQFCRFHGPDGHSAFLRLDSMSISELLDIEKKYSAKYNEEREKWLASQEQDICLKLLLGTKHNPKIKGVGSTRAKQIVKKYETRDAIFEFIRQSKRYTADFNLALAYKKIRNDLGAEVVFDVELDEPVDAHVSYKPDGITDPIQGTILKDLASHWINMLEH